MSSKNSNENILPLLLSVSQEYINLLTLFLILVNSHLIIVALSLIGSLN